jgi:DNA-binding GntR family transcriptional regulator
MTDADVAELLGYGEAMDTAARAGDGRAVAEADAAFHGRIVELAANPTLLGMWQSLAPFSRTYMSLVGPGADPEWSARLHAPILDALRARDVEAVVQALETHFVEARENMAGRLAEADPPVEDAVGAQGRA